MNIFKQIIPMRKAIVFESKPDFADNSRPIYEEFVKRGINERYELIKKIPCPPQLTGYEYELIKACEAIEKGQTECEDMPHERTIYMMELMDSIRAQYSLKYPFEK